MLGFVTNRHYPSAEVMEIEQKFGNKAIIGCDAHYPEMLNDDYSIKKCRKLTEKYSLELVDYIKGLEP